MDIISFTLEEPDPSRETNVITTVEFLMQDKALKEYIYQLLTLDLIDKNTAIEAIKQKVQETGNIIILLRNNRGEIWWCLLWSKTTDQGNGYYILHSLWVIETWQKRAVLLNILIESLQKHNETPQT